MANHNEKKGMLIDVQPIKSKEKTREMLEALGRTKEFGLRNQLLFKPGISTGLRCGDLVALKVEQVKGKSSFKIREGKTKKERTVHLDQLMAAIADYIDTLPPRTAYLFPSRKGDAILVRRKLTALLLMLAFKSVIIRLVLTQCARRSVILITTLLTI